MPRIVDLRFPEELADDEPRDVGIDVVHVSVLGAGPDPEYVRELDAHLASVDDVADHYAWSYVDFLSGIASASVRRSRRSPTLTAPLSFTVSPARTARVSSPRSCCVSPVSTTPRSALTTQ